MKRKHWAVAAAVGFGELAAAPPSAQPPAIGLLPARTGAAPPYGQKSHCFSAKIII